MSSGDKVVLYDSDEAASFQTITISGWVSRNGRFYGENEDLARYDGSTHKKCVNFPDAHPVHETRSYCKVCSLSRLQDNYQKKQPIPWEGTEPVTILDGDEWFFNEDELFEWCIENELDVRDLLLVHSEKEYLHKLDADNEWLLGEDQELPEEVYAAVEELNEVIANQAHIGYVHNTFRVGLSEEQLARFDKMRSE